MLDVIYKKCMQYLFGRKREFRLTAKQEYDYLEEIGIPKSDIEASFFQYKCQNAVRMNRLTLSVFNAGSSLLIFPMIIYYFLINLFPHKTDDKSFVTEKGLVKNRLIPKELVDRYGNPTVMEKNHRSLTFDDLFFIFKIWKKYPISIFFLCKCVYMIATYSYVISRYRPRVILVGAEYSFTSSILTLYCEKNDVLHFNVLHGDKRFDIVDAYARFHKFYVWDEHYIHLFKSLKTMTRSSDFVLYEMELPELNIEFVGGKCTYYLQVVNKDLLRKIKTSLEKIGMTYRVRPHPLYNKEEIYETFDEECIENISKVDIYTSLAKAGMAIGQDSTVLFQAYLLGIPVVLDDVTDPSFFGDLCERQYIMLSKPHQLLSKMVSKIC